MEQNSIIETAVIIRHTSTIPRIHCKNGIFKRFFLKDYIEERAVEIATYIIETSATVRQTARKFGISKSTVHKDVSSRLLRINRVLAVQVREILNENKAERHIRGGMATKHKYEEENRRKNKNLEDT